MTAAEAPGFRPEGLAAADDVIRQGVESGGFPGAVYAVGRAGGSPRVAAFGTLTRAPGSPPALASTIYDLASLTKVVVTTTLLMQLAEEGLDLEAPVAGHIPEFRGGGRDAVRIRHLLSHSSGLPGWRPLHRDASSREDLVRRVIATDLEAAPGARAEYSDLGFILVGEVIERIAGDRIDVLARRRILEPLGLAETDYCPALDRVARIAPTEVDPWRGRLLQGEVHDENAHAMGGVAAHAGLFGTAADLSRFASLLLGHGLLDGQRWLRAETVSHFTARGDIPGSTWALGWDTPAPAGYTSAGRSLSPRSFGHLGFTGTSLWIDPDRELYVLLLSNRVHPTRDNDGIRAVRPALADAVVAALA